MKLFSWIPHDVFVVGLIAINWILLQVESLITAIDMIEKLILFICTLFLIIYRIDSLRLDNKKKKIEIKKMEKELSGPGVDIQIKHIEL